ncbi:MAG: hypothetical protein M3490_09175, partial [Chloroflexota bacterium]|nr:hypothetical protein [Chloroflexota bacterium]
GHRGKKGGVACLDHLRITIPERRRLLVRLAWPVAWNAAHVIGWSRWRRAHQRAAQEAHQRRRLKHLAEREL